MTLRRRLLLLFAVFLLLLAANAAQAWLNLTTRSETQAEIAAFEQARDTLTLLMAAHADEQASLRGYVITEDEAMLESYHTARTLGAGHGATLADFAAGDPTLARGVEAIVPAERRWREAVSDPVIAAMREGRVADARALVASERGQRLFDEMREETFALRLALRARGTDAELRLSDLQRSLEALAWQTFVAGLVLLGLAGWLVRRWVTWPLDEIATATRAVADGDLTLHIPTPGPPDVATLGRDVERMRGRIVDELERAGRAREALTQEGPAVVALRDHLAPEEGKLPDGVGFAATLEAGWGELAGDWYDAPRLDDDRIGVVVGDVSGQGATAGVLAVRVKQLLLAALRDGRDPGSALGWTARHVGDTGERFATAFVAVVDTASWTCRWASAGHPPALVTGNGGIDLLEATGPLLGPFPWTWDTVQTPLVPGGLLVACTDGVLEARDDRGEQFGLERLADAVGRAEAKGPAAVVAACIDGLRAYAASTADDLTVVALGRAPVEGAAAWPYPSGVSSAQ